MSNGQTQEWSDQTKKNAAVHKFLRYLALNHDQAMKCVGKEDEAAKLFTAVTKMAVPPGEQVVLFAPGAAQRHEGGPVMLEVPPSDLENPQTADLHQFVISPYIYWEK